MKRHWIPVVAGALFAESGSVLMHRRPFEKHHGGLWEFPGGKVEDAEIPVEALRRELREELGIAILSDDCLPCCFAEEPVRTDNEPIVILLYRIARWSGEPAALEGGEIGWFSPQEIIRLDKPPLDDALCAHLFGRS